MSKRGPPTNVLLRRLTAVQRVRTLATVPHSIPLRTCVAFAVGVGLVSLLSTRQAYHLSAALMRAAGLYDNQRWAT